MHADLLHGFHLGEVLIEPLKGQVTRSAGVRHLPPTAMDVLLCLAGRAGEVVSRETLLAEVWGEGHGSSESLSHAVSEIRHALDDHAENPTFIQTLPKRGYRLVVEPSFVADHTTSTVLALDPRLESDPGFFDNLKQRGVIETGLAYLIFGWLLIQVADIVFAQLHLPSWAGTFVTVFVIAGFPIAIVLSWYLEFRDGRAVVHEVAPQDAQRQRFTRTYISVIAALAMASVLVFIYDRFVTPLPTEAVVSPVATAGIDVELPIAENSIAVLPFVNVDQSAETQIFTNGFVDDIINRLALVPGLLVSSRGDAFTLAPNSASADVRKRLRVARYLEGSVEIAGDRMRIIVQLIDSSDGFHIMSRTFDRPVEDFFDIRDEVTELTVASLRVTLPEATQALSAMPAARPDLDAYVLYRHGVDVSRLPQSMETIAEAINWFDAALGVDPDFAAALAGKCNVYATGYRLSDSPDYIAAAEQACARALELNPNLDVVHTALGDLYRMTGEYERSATAYTRALSINPKSVDSLMGLGEVYRLQQHPDEAMEALRQAIGLQPGNWSPYNALGVFYYRQGEFLKAAEQFAYVVALDQDNMRGQANLATAYMLAGDFARAAPAFERAIEIQPQANTWINLGLMYYYLGRSDDAVAAMQNALALAPNDHLAWSNLGDILWQAGRFDEANDAFARALELASAELEINPNNPNVIMDLAWAKAMLGEQQAADYDIERAIVMSPDDPYGYYIKGLIELRGGDEDAALDALEGAAAKGYGVVMLAAEPHLASLRDNPRFRAIIGEPLARDH